MGTIDIAHLEPNDLSRAHPAAIGERYVFGRTGSRVVIEDGRKRVIQNMRKAQKDWDVLIRDHHEGYLDWTEYERNQRLIADNVTGKYFPSRGAIRRGEALLAGLLRCGHCGRKLHVAYSGKGGNTGRYHCRGGAINHGGARCISFGGMRVASRRCKHRLPVIIKR